MAADRKSGAAAQSSDTPGPATTETEDSRSLLRFTTCGSVDDGKSTLVGRLLHDLGQVPSDQFEALQNDSRKHGTTGGDIDFALLVDGLSAEREQGITIDVAYRYFSTPHRSFILADAPGHEQYTRNMATGVSVSDLALILVDARKGVVIQTRRHAIIAHLLGIRHVLVTINKMDLVDYDQSRFEVVRQEFEDFAKKIGISDVVTIPVVARAGDNLVVRSERMGWYGGPTVIEHLDAVAPGGSADQAGGSIFPVQWVNRPNADFRGLSGTLARGILKPGDEVVVLPSAVKTRIAQITTYDGSVDEARSGDAVTVVLGDDVDASRGAVIAAADDRPGVTDQACAHLIWLSEEPMLPGRNYLIKCAGQMAIASITQLKHKLNVETLDMAVGRNLKLNDIGVCNLSFNRPIVFTPYTENRTLGAFILIDRISRQTVGAGMLQFALRRAVNLHWQAGSVDKSARAEQKAQKPFCLWFTGLSGSGKSTIANALDRRLFELGHHAFVLDGDNVRHGLNRDLGFTDADRVENVRRVAEVSKLMNDAGLITMVALISPFRSERQMARELFGDGAFIEVFVDAPLAVCEERDPKGLYRRARQGAIQNFTGIDSPYEPPEAAEIRLRTDQSDAESLADDIIQFLHQERLI
jgi:bifunctional enzyme CysN/CysC